MNHKTHRLSLSPTIILIMLLIATLSAGMFSQLAYKDKVQTAVDTFIQQYAFKTIDGNSERLTSGYNTILSIDERMELIRLQNEANTLYPNTEVIRSVMLALISEPSNVGVSALDESDITSLINDTGALERVLDFILLFMLIIYLQIQLLLKVTALTLRGVKDKQVKAQARFEAERRERRKQLDELIG